MSKIPKLETKYNKNKYNKDISISSDFSLVTNKNKIKSNETNNHIKKSNSTDIINSKRLTKNKHLIETKSKLFNNTKSTNNKSRSKTPVFNNTKNNKRNFQYFYKTCEKKDTINIKNNLENNILINTNNNDIIKYASSQDTAKFVSKSTEKKEKEFLSSTKNIEKAL